MKKMLAIACMGCGWMATTSSHAQTADTRTGGNTSTPAANRQLPVYRDPRTGQLYQQELKTVDQTVTTWQRKLVNQTVVTPQTVVESQQVPQTYYVAKTEYILQPKLKGWWNPLAQPTYAYEYVPVTRWVPQTQMVTRQVSTVKMLARIEQVPVDEPVQTTQKVTHVVMHPLPATAAANYTAGALPPGAVTTSLYAQSRARASQSPQYRRTPSGAQSATWTSSTYAKNAYGSNSQPQPMNVASQPNTNWGRDFNQAGMPVTVVR